MKSVSAYPSLLTPQKLVILNQARAGRRAWFLRIASVRELLYACLCVCVGYRFVHTI